MVFKCEANQIESNQTFPTKGESPPLHAKACSPVLQDLFGSRLWVTVSDFLTQKCAVMRITIHASVVRFNMRPLHLAILNDQSISLAAVSTEDGSAVERQIQSPSKSESRISNEANLTLSAYSNAGGISTGTSAWRFMAFWLRDRTCEVPEP